MHSQLPGDANVIRITQAELERLNQIVRQRDRLEEEYRDMRASILHRYRGGVSVESGRLGLKVWESERSHITRKALLRALGAREAERLIKLLPPTKQTNVKVTRSQ
jgi:hypothetical protein